MDVGDTLHAKITDGGGDNRHADSRRNQADDGLHLVGLLHDVRAEARLPTQAEDLIIKAGTESTWENDKRIFSQTLKAVALAPSRGMNSGKSCNKRLLKQPALTRGGIINRGAKK